MALFAPGPSDLATAPTSVIFTKSHKLKRYGTFKT